MTLRKLLTNKLKLHFLFLNTFLKRNEKLFIEKGIAQQKKTGKRRTLIVEDYDKALNFIRKMPEVRNILLKRKYKSARSVLIENGAKTTYIHKYLNEKYLVLKKSSVIEYVILNGRKIYYCVDSKRLVADFFKYDKRMRKERNISYTRPYRLIKDTLKVNETQAYKIFKSLLDKLIEKKLIKLKKSNTNKLYEVIDEKKFVRYLKNTEECKNLYASRKYNTVHSILNTKFKVNNNLYYYLLKSNKDVLLANNLIKIVKVKSKTYHYSLNDIEIIKYFENKLQEVDYDKCA